MAKAKIDIKSAQSEAQKTAQTAAQRTFHAAVGVTDLAVEVVRDYVADVQKRLTTAQKNVTSFEPQALRDQAIKDAKARRTAIEKRVVDLQAEARTVPARVQKLVDANVSTATDTYADLVKRGELLVGRIRGQESTQATVAAAETTVAKARTTNTQATKAAKKTSAAAKRSAAATKKRNAPARSSAKATRTAAKKTVSSAARAVVDAAEKVGD
jgi:heparin binding hemagglutinin HbhA